MAALITEDDRKKIYDDLAETMISAIERSELPLSEIKKSAQFILEKLDGTRTEEDLIAFLQALSERWKMYAIELLQYEGRKKQAEDMIKIQEIQQKLSSFASL